MVAVQPSRLQPLDFHIRVGVQEERTVRRDLKVRVCINAFVPLPGRLIAKQLSRGVKLDSFAIREPSGPYWNVTACPPPRGVTEASLFCASQVSVRVPSLTMLPLAS